MTDVMQSICGNLIIENFPQWKHMNGGVGEGKVHVILIVDEDIIIGGAFLEAGGIPAKNLARWVRNCCNFVPFHILKVIVNVTFEKLCRCRARGRGVPWVISTVK